MPFTRFDLIDQSGFNPVQTLDNNSPVYLCGITSDKGPEDVRLVRSDMFQKLYGKVSFAKHGQPLLQADRIVNAGATLMVKRVVAANSTLANAIVVAKVKTVQQQKRDAQGNLLYDLNGVETTDPTGADPIMVDYAHIKTEVQTVSGAADKATINAAMSSIFTETPDAEGYKVYPIAAIVDIGRGVSAKKFRIAPDYDGSKNLEFLQYQLDIIENNEKIETFNFALDPDRIHNNVNYSLESVVNRYSNQVRAELFETYFAAYIAELKAITGADDTLINQDILFGKTRTATLLPQFEFNASNINLSQIYGIALASGTNGAFGTAPWGTAEYETEMAKFFNGTLTDDVFDLDKFKIDVVMDANYPAAVKRAIESLVTYREDAMYFRDLGIVKTIEGMKAAQAQGTLNKFCTSNHLSYDVIEPVSKKQITVTYTYTLGALLVDHLKNRRNCPVAGDIYGMILSDAIEGTINYLPKKTPSLDQKVELEDSRINYASWYGDKLILETQFTSQPVLSQFSYTSNILAIQEVIKAIRTRCPKIRYSFIDGDDLTTYMQDVQAVINKYTDNFREITFEYIEDESMAQNKIFYAAIKVKFRNYVESEWFKIYAIK